MSKITTGKLEYSDGDQYTCVNCGTSYISKYGKAKCNGHIITLCPWCRPDSKPWTNGRGI